MSVSINGAGSISGLDQGFNVTTGSVGIGTDNPTQKLELLSTGNTIIKLGGASANTTGIIINRGGSEVSRIAHANSDDLSFYTTSSVTERLRITSAGKVGIGADDPKQFLSVVGRATFDQAGDYYGAWINGNSTADSSFNVGAWYNVGGRLRDNGNHVVLESMNTSHYVQLQPSGGNVGVGENGPNAKLHVTKDNDVAYTPSQATQDSNNQIKIENHSTTTDSFVSMAMRARACDFHLGVKNNGADNSGRLFLVHQDTTNKEVVSVTSAGNVGINETNPIGDLSITGANGSTMEFQPDIVSGTNRITNFNRSTSTYKAFRLDASQHEFLISGTERMRINADGYVTKPNQPRFFARRSAHYTGYDGRNVGGTWIPFDVLDYNVGGGFQTSGSDQGRFVAPVSGLYLFHASTYKGTGNADWSQSWFDVDGSRANGTDWVVDSSRFAQNAIQVYMTAGQKIGFHPYNNQTNNEIRSTANHTWFKGCLLG